MKITLKKTLKNKALSPNKIYFVIGIEANYYRIINDNGNPVLYSPRLFRIVDHAVPQEWIIERGSENEKYAYPLEMNSPGFFEDYFDNDPGTVKIFLEYLKKKKWSNQIK